jgi:betaine lipid synthase
MASVVSEAYHKFASPVSQVTLATWCLVIIIFAYLTLSFTELSLLRKTYNVIWHYGTFAYSCFLKPHSGDASGNQQEALESFYSSQASVYDVTRNKLLQGREDMLALVAAQVKHRTAAGELHKKPIWVDIGGGTGWNIEQMQKYVDVQTFFHAVYLVDLSSSLCKVARERFQRLGWKNVHVICEDARTFRLSDYEAGLDDSQREFSIGKSAYEEDVKDTVGADVLTMSYSLSMIPEFHSAIDSITNLLSPTGIVGVVDFYVLNQI